MPAKSNPRPLTKKAFNNVKLDDLKRFYDRVFRELNLTKQPIRARSSNNKDTYIDRLLPILNEYEYYFYEGKIIDSYWIGHFIERVKPKILMNQFNEENNITMSAMSSDDNKKDYQKFFFSSNDENDKQPMEIEIVHPRMNEAINDILIEEEEEEKEPPFINTNQTFQNEILFSGQNQMNQAAKQKQDNLLAAINKFNEVALHPIAGNELSGDVEQDTQLLLNRLVELKTRYSANGKASSKIGMGELAKIILDLQRDVKRVSKAISPQGAEEMVNKHNRGLPENSASRWRFVHKDVNRDGIPDVLITNSKGHPLYVNGYTTTKSDHPIRYEFYKEHPSSEDRRQALAHFGSMSNYAKDKFGVKYNDDFEGDLHKLGEMTSYQKPESWNNYILENYKGFPKKKKDLSGFDRFKKYVLGDKFNDVIEALRQQKVCNIPGKYKIRVIAKATAELWKVWILSKIAEAYNTTINSEAMERIKKTAEGKRDINAVVSSLLNDLNLINPDAGWTEEKRQELENQLYEEIAQAVVHFAEEIVPRQELHQLNEQELNTPLFEQFPVELATHADKSHGGWNQEKHGEFGGYDFTHPMLKFNDE